MKIQLGGALKDFIIVHQGYPSSLYDSSCNGTWVLQKEIPRKYKWYNDNNDHWNTYPDSYMDTYANNEYFNSIEADIRNRIKQVKNPIYVVWVCRSFDRSKRSPRLRSFRCLPGKLGLQVTFVHR